MLLLGFHSGQKKAHASRKVLRVSYILQQCVMGIDKRSIPDCVSAQFFLTRVNRVNFVVTNVEVELRGTLVWFDSRIGLLQEKLQVYGWFWNFWHCMHASPNPACKSLWKLCEKNTENIARNIDGYYRLRTAIQLEFLQKKLLLSQGGPFWCCHYHGKS